MCTYNLKIVCRHRRKSGAHYSDYDVPDEEDPEVSSFFSEALQNDGYDVSYARDPYAAFDPDVSATSEDNNHEPAESGSAQRSFKKIGEQWGAMVTPQLADRDRSYNKDSRSRYSEEKSARRDVSSRHDRYNDRRGRLHPAATRTPPGPSPELSVHDQAVGTTPRVTRLVSEEVQTAVEDARPSPRVVDDNGLTSGDDGILHRDMVDREVQCCSRTAADLLRKEYTRLTLFCDSSSWFTWYRLQLII